MSFTSVHYLLFLVSVAAAYWAMRTVATRIILLLLAGYVFYGWMHPAYCAVLFLSTLLTYGCLQSIWRSQYKGLSLSVGVVCNIGLLLVLKYAHVFMPDGQEAGWMLPLGASFYLLQAVGMLVDAYRGDLTRHAFQDVALFLAFFPKLIAGPFEKSAHFMADMRMTRRFDPHVLLDGCGLLLMGFFKKLAVADAIRPFTALLFADQHPSVALLFAAGICFAIQILADFSGYTDIARGSAKLLGITLLENFHAPYLALTPSDFWRRWHSSFSQWFRDYVYIPLGGSRVGGAWRYLGVLLATMGLSGMWHGATFNFFLWGCYQGLLLFAYDRLGFGARWRPRTVVHWIIAWLIMTGWTLCGWIIFNAPGTAWVGRAFLQPDLRVTAVQIGAAALWVSLSLAYALPWFISWIALRTSHHSWVRGAAYAVVSLALLVNQRDAPVDFYYFRF